MKKLTKMGIDALRETLPVLSREEQSSYMGMYSGDCFWRCVAFLSSGDFSENGAGQYAWDYITELCGDYRYALHRLEVTAWIGISEASGYLSQNSHLRMTGMDIACVNPNAFSSYSGYLGHMHQTPDGSWMSYDSGHYVVILPGETSGVRTAYDPTFNRHFTITSGEYENHVRNNIV